MTTIPSNGSIATMFIILVGTPGSGKDTIARYLETKHGFSRVGTEASTGAVSCRINTVLVPSKGSDMDVYFTVQGQQQQALSFSISKLPPRLCHPKLAVKLCYNEHNQRARSFTIYQEAICFGCGCRWAVDDSMAAESEQVSQLSLGLEFATNASSILQIMLK
jgi:hypothetical protein